jgi:hypothetical protein
MLHIEFNTLKQLASPEVRALFTIFGHWLFEGTPGTVCLDGIEEAVQELRHSTQGTAAASSPGK